MKGIILAAGKGTRLHPITLSYVKQLIPIYDKPMIYYPLATLMSAGIRDIMIITNPDDVSSMKRLFGDGSFLSCNISYEIQEDPRGIADAFLIAEDFIGDSPVCLILGDNIFYSSELSTILKTKVKFWDGHRGVPKMIGASVFAYRVSDPERYGVVSFDDRGIVKSLVEKPKNPESNYAVPGLYFYDNRIVSVAKSLDLSDRLELEITDVNKEYMSKGQLSVTVLDRGTAWLDTGTVESLMDASLFIQITEARQGIKIGCIEEIAYQNGWIDLDQLKESAKRYEKTGYGKYLNELINENSK
jgi:glucose-1-phosphate thymidylyltransferase